MNQADRGILFFLCLTDRGGAEISMLALAQGLASRGYKITLAVYGTHPALARECGFTGELIELGARRTLTAILPLYRLLCARRFATLISALTHTNIAAIAAACLAGGKTRAYLCEHGNDGIITCVASSLFAFITRLAYKRANAIIAVSQGLAKKWREILPAQAHVVTIYNPAVPDILPPTPPPAHAWLADKETPVIIGIGRLREEKNFSLLVQAFAKILAFKQARLIILGEGDQRPLLERQIQELGLSDTILLPGFVTDSGAWLGHAALFVSPSRREGFGNALVEALAHGVPVVATDCPFGPAEILDRGRYGRLVPMDDADRLAQAMIEALAAPPDTRHLQNRALSFTASRCIDAYSRLIDNRASSGTP